MYDQVSKNQLELNLCLFDHDNFGSMVLFHRTAQITIQSSNGRDKGDQLLYLTSVYMS